MIGAVIAAAAIVAILALLRGGIQLPRRQPGEATENDTPPPQRDWSWLKNNVGMLAIGIGILVLAGVLYSNGTITTITTTVTSNPIYAILALAGIAYLFYSNRAYRLMEQEEQKNTSLNKEKAVGKLFLLLLIIGVGFTSFWTWLKGIGPNEIDYSINLAREALTGTMSDGVTQVATNENITRGVLALGIAIALLAIMSIFSKGAHSLLRLLGLLLAAGILGYSFTQFAPTQTAHIKNWVVKTWELAQETATTPRPAGTQPSSAGATTALQPTIRTPRSFEMYYYDHNLHVVPVVEMSAYDEYHIGIWTREPQIVGVRPENTWLDGFNRKYDVKLTAQDVFVCSTGKYWRGSVNRPVFTFRLKPKFIADYMNGSTPTVPSVPVEAYADSTEKSRWPGCEQPL